jgi:ABC-2 type transport system ATP-binding protein
MKMLCGLLRPTRGELRVGGFDAVTQAAEVRKILGYIPDTPFLYDRLTPVEFMEFIGDVYGFDRDHIRREREHWFKLLGLDEYRSTLIKDLSHGWRQRVVYASTFLHQPQVLLVDEPFIGLDPHSIRLIKNLLKEKVRAGMTIILTTHILALAEDLADRLGIIQHGELVALGTLPELLAMNKNGGRLEDAFLSITGEA